MIKTNKQTGLKVTSCDQTVQILQPTALHKSLCGLSGTKEMFAQAKVKVPLQEQNSKFLYNMNSTVKEVVGN